MSTTSPRRALQERNGEAAVGRQALQEVNAPSSDGLPPPLAYKELSVTTSPAVKGRGCAPLSKRAQTPLASHPQLFTPGGCPQDAEDCYMDFGTTFISGPKTEEPKKSAKQALRQRGGSVDGPQAPLGHQRAPAAGSRRLRDVEEEEEEPMACMEPAQCTVS